MSSFRSHFRQHLQQNGPTNQNKQSSRIPTRASDAESNTTSKATQQATKQAKRSSRSIAAESVATKSSVKAAAPPSSVTQNKRASVAMANAQASRHSLLPAPPAIRTPSLVSGSSASTFDSPRSNGLRRKPSGAIESYAAQRRAESAEGDMDRTARHSRNAFEDSVFGISMPYVSSYGGQDMDMEYPLTTHNKQDHAATGSFALNITPPIPPSLTPSTGYTDSPFSHVPTISSASSVSPGIVATSNTSIRQRPTSPTKTRGGLPPVRESSTSSGSTVRNPSVKMSASRKESLRGTSANAAPTPSDSRQPVSRSRLTKTAPVQSASARKVYPELAHLNVDPPAKPDVQKPLPPIRPSRDGTPDLSGMENQASIVQSDLPRLYTSYHKRTPSQDTPCSAPSPGFKSRFGFSPKVSSRSESPRVDSAISPPPATRRFSRGPTPDLPSSEGAPLRRQDSPAISASPSKSSRFGFFMRKPKGESAKPTEKPKRAPTKGPVAGTGHEGYGRFGFRGRSGSTTSSTDFRSPSADSSTSSSSVRPKASRQSSLASKDGSDLDDFLRERLNPVVLRGSGGRVVSDKPPTPSVTGNGLQQVPSRASTADSLSRAQTGATSVTGANEVSSQKRHVLRRSRPSMVSKQEINAQQPTLATRRSLTRMSRSSSRSPVRVLPPINTNIATQQRSIDSYDAETSAWPQTDSTLPPSGEAFHGQEGLWLRSLDEEPAKPPRKLNFLQRALASPRDKGKAKASDNNVARGSVAGLPLYQGLAYHDVASVDLDEVGRIVRETEGMTDSSTSEEYLQSKLVPYQKRHVSMLPSPPKLDSQRNSVGFASATPPRIKVNRQDSSDSQELLRAKPLLPRQTANVVHIQRSPSTSQPQGKDVSRRSIPGPVQGEAPKNIDEVVIRTPELNVDNSPKQPRLSPVGRIPKVVSKRDRDRKLPDTSFSRPFARNQPRPSVKPPGSVYSQIREMASPIENDSRPLSVVGAQLDEAAGEAKRESVSSKPEPSTERASVSSSAQEEFFAFARKMSDQSVSTSSGIPSWMSALYAQPPQQEDPWDEYNDLIDEVIPSKAKTANANASLGAPFQYAKAVPQPKAPINIPSLLGPPPTAELPLPPGMAPVQTVLSVPQQVSRFLQPSLSPMTPDTLSGFISGYGNRSTSTLFVPNRASNSAMQRSGIPQPARSSLQGVRESMSSSRYSQSSGHSRSASLPEHSRRNSQSSLAPDARFSRETQFTDIVEADGKPPLTASLRRGALMTSKWLSFGRILFSPAHNEIKFAKEPRVLVVDGLNSDWSYYVALSYPSADVYHLGFSKADSDIPKWPSADHMPPENHHHIRVSAMSAAFPFPKGFFTAVVFRFPTATTEQVYQTCVSECKRVLRPGGYLEVAVLDLDLMNMSAKARKAVRDLKTRMQETDRDVCLSNLSDVLVRLIGRRGFNDVQRCIVGVPAAGRIPRSRDNSSISSDSSGRPIWHREDHSPPQQEEEFSFADLIKDTRDNNPIGPGKRNDESITKMVAKVGRWWYSTCYERSLLPGDRSIWADRALLRECEKQGTSFRLLICHAQKPTQPRRRTVSV